MNLIVESSALLHPLTGIGRYTNELVNGLLDPCFQEDFKLRFWVQNVLLSNFDEVKRLKPRTDFPLWSKPFRVVNNRYRLWVNAQVLKSTLFHGTNFFIPEVVEHGVITVHDLSVFLYPAAHPVERVRQFEAHFERSIRQSKRIITDSEFVRQEMITRFSCAESQVVTIHIGVASAYKPKTFINHELMIRYGLKNDEYALCVATIEPRKNIDKLLHAYSLMPPDLRNRYPLVLVGGYGWLAEDIVRQIDEGSKQGWVKKLGYVAEHDLIGVYQHARIFAYPSAYEGFGLPVLEAMACGIPVLTSNRSSLPEVAGGVAVLVDPDDAVELALGLEQALVDEAWRNSSRQAGLQRARSFTWDKCVNETVNVYKAVSATM